MAVMLAQDRGIAGRVVMMMIVEAGRRLKQMLVDGVQLEDLVGRLIEEGVELGDCCGVRR